MATLNFKGKTFVQNHHLAVKYHQLVPKKEKSLTDKVSLKDNLIIHGDNLKALKALLPTYAGKVKCIYIDPPYNTGKEKWVYNDNVNSPMMQEWLGKVVDKEDLTRHDKWLCMMMPRLKLLRELLSEDGAIMISIDDENEPHRLRMLLDEVFGEENFICTFVWKKKSGAGNTETYVGILTEYVLFYAKNKTIYKTNRRNIDKDFSFLDEKENAYYTFEGMIKTDKGTYKRDTMKFPIINPETGEKVFPPENKRWTIGKKTCDELLKQGLLVFLKDKTGNTVVKLKKFLSDTGVKGVFLNLLIYKGSLESAKNELEEIGFERELFDTPKPSILVKHLLSIASDKSSIILDSFAGSGTTAHAVLDLNKEDGGNRKFVLVECEDYADTITAERVRRVIKGVPNAKDEKLREGLGGTFSYFELGDPIEMESILEGDNLPSYLELARYVFYTATGEEFDPEKVDENRNFIGESKEYEVYLFYKTDIEYLKSTALTLERAKKLGPYVGKKRLVFAPSKYLDNDYLLEYRIDYCQLPFEIYKLRD